jgi:hypothetical protein
LILRYYLGLTACWNAPTKSLDQAFLKRIFNHLAKFAIDFGNVNFMSRSRLLTELNTNPLTKVLTVLKAFKDQLTFVQSTNSPITILAATVSKFSTRTPVTNPFFWFYQPLFPSALPQYWRTPRTNAAMSSATPLPQTRALKRLPHSAKRNPTATVPPTLQSNNQSLIWAYSSSLETTPRPLTSSPRTYPPRFVLTLLVRVVNIPESPAHTATPGMLMNYLQKLLLQLLLTSQPRKLVGSTNGTS